MRQPHPRVVRSLVVLIAATFTLGALAIGGWTGPDDPKPPADRTPEDATLPGPDDVAVEEPPSVPTVVASNRTFSCPGGAYAFHNPALHYRLCYPDDWGFTDFGREDRLDTIPGAQLENLHLVSGEAFPWEVGSYPFDAVTEKQAIDVELNLLQPGVVARGECEPSKARASGELQILTCTQAYDTLGQPSDAGPITAVKFVVPLLRTPVSANTRLDLNGSRLLVIVRTSTARALKEVDLGWQLVRSIRPY